jgi:hypothetical protein
LSGERTGRQGSGARAARAWAIAGVIAAQVPLGAYATLA